MFYSAKVQKVRDTSKISTHKYICTKTYQVFTAFHFNSTLLKAG